MLSFPCSYVLNAPINTILIYTIHRWSDSRQTDRSVTCLAYGVTRSRTTLPEFIFDRKLRVQHNWIQLNYTSTKLHSSFATFDDQMDNVYRICRTVPTAEIIEATIPWYTYNDTNNTWTITAECFVKRAVLFPDKYAVFIWEQLECRAIHSFERLIVIIDQQLRRLNSGPLQQIQTFAIQPLCSPHQSSAEGRHTTNWKRVDGYTCVQVATGLCVAYGKILSCNVSDGQKKKKNQNKLWKRSHWYGHTEQERTSMGCTRSTCVSLPRLRSWHFKARDKARPALWTFPWKTKR